MYYSLVDFKMCYSDPLTLSTVTAWQIIQKLEGRSYLFTPFCNNPLFPPGISGSGFRVWATKGISVLSDLMDKSNWMSFDQLITKYNIHRHDFFQYLQVRDDILKNTMLSNQYVSG